jgi:hypothetical protein
MALKVPKKYRYQWEHPWTRRAKYGPRFRMWLARNGRLSPHFTYAEAACKDGTQIPKRLRTGARNHAFNLERFRHELGDQTLTPLSWYRHPAYNRKVGGASQSQHLTGRATDFSRETVERVGRDRWNRAAEKVFKNGGVGSYPAGSAHLDSRGFRARWSSFRPGR